MFQRDTYEEEPGLQSTFSYQEGYRVPQSRGDTGDMSLRQIHANVPGQKLLMSDLGVGNTPNSGQRLILSIVSIAFTFVMFLITLFLISSSYYNPFPAIPLTLFITGTFIGVLLYINVLFNRRN